MKGIPKKIQTRKDLQNLFGLAQEGTAGVEKAELAERIRELLATQYRRVPILSASAAVVTTMYFPEAVKNAPTENGETIKNVVHIEDPDAESGSTQYSNTEITLSKAPKDNKVISVYMEDNFLTQNDFDIPEINYMLGVLETDDNAGGE